MGPWREASWSGRGSGLIGLCPAVFGTQGSRSTIPESQGTEWTQPRIPHSPQDRRRWGGHRTARTLLPLGSLKLYRSVPPPPGSTQTSADCEVEVVVIGGYDSRAGELAAASVVFLLCHFVPGRGDCHGTEASQYRYLPLSSVPGRRQGSNLRCTHT